MVLNYWLCYCCDDNHTGPSQLGGASTKRMNCVINIVLRLASQTNLTIDRSILRLNDLNLLLLEYRIRQATNFSNFLGGQSPSSRRDYTSICKSATQRRLDFCQPHQPVGPTSNDSHIIRRYDMAVIELMANNRSYSSIRCISEIDDPVYKCIVTEPLFNDYPTHPSRTRPVSSSLSPLPFAEFPTFMKSTHAQPLRKLRSHISSKPHSTST